MSRRPSAAQRGQGIPEATIARLPVYLRVLYTCAEQGIATVSSEELAAAAGVNSAKLRKDLSHLGSYGTRGVGYDVDYLVYQVSRELGLTQDWPVVIVGAGNLGRALANYGGFASRGFRIAAVLDTDPAVVGTEVAAGLVVVNAEAIEEVVARHSVSIGVIATPANTAQDVCDRLVGAGVTSILSFAPVTLTVPAGVDVRKVELSIELQILAFHAQRRSVVRIAADGKRHYQADGVGLAALAGGVAPAREAAVTRMSVLVVGMSYRSTPVTVLERAAVTGDELGKLIHDVYQADDVAGTFVVSTCNRVEVYAEVDKFHAGVSAICDLLARHAGIALNDLTPHLYVHYEDRAVQHLLSMTCGLESMVVGESQILGQVRQSLALARREATLGRVLDDLGSLALRTGKRAHAETGIDRSGANLVSVGVGLAASLLAPDPARPLDGLSVLVVGAGSMSSLAAATAARLGAAAIVVANRTQERAKRLAASVHGATADLANLPDALAAADLVISCTGAPALVITADKVAAALRRRKPATGGPADREPANGEPRPLVLLDLALPRDVEPGEAGQLPGVTVLGLDSLQDAGAIMAATQAQDVAAVRAIVAEELAARLSAMQAARVAPTVVALRAKAVKVVEAELARLGGRLGQAR